MFWCSMYVLPMIVFFGSALIWTCTWSIWWVLFAAAMGTIQVFTICLVAAYIGSGYYTEKRWLPMWADYFSRWQEVNVLQNQILEGMYNMMSFIHQEQVRKKEAFEVMLKDLGMTVDNVEIPEGMEDFCKKVKF